MDSLEISPKTQGKGPREPLINFPSSTKQDDSLPVTEAKAPETQSKGPQESLDRFLHPPMQDDSLSVTETQSKDPQQELSIAPFVNITARPAFCSTVLGSVLRSLPARVFLGYEIGNNPRTLLSVETERHMPASLRASPTPLDQIKLPEPPSPGDSRITSYFSSVHRFYPILEVPEFELLLKEVRERGFSPDVGSAQVLVVLALSMIALAKPNLSDPDWSPGAELLTPAVNILLTVDMGPLRGSLIAAQSLFLAGPAQCWRMVHTASKQLQLFWSSRGGLGARRTQSTLCLFWTIFMMEWLNQIHHRESEVLNKIQTPREMPGEAGAQSLVDHPAEVISKKFTFELDQWLKDCKLDIGDSSPSIDRAVLAMRYHSSGVIISRPYLIQVCALSPYSTPEGWMVDWANRCLLHCRGCLLFAKDALREPSGSLGMFLQV
ncbi:hypothetical protein B0T10DRAFT_546577 [Thelonectria olida]|uniref:Transcription factor domain-containing protein n=1 Tax=Thelonectria olida TaxID=1576542 RepID=A0A9P8W8U0_9HYPO|nr:hypothetical protein B0T10DRAFT_546577 [Thelonectria olida]